MLESLINSESLNEVIARFNSEEACIQYLIENRWKTKVDSPFFQNSKVYSCKDGRFRCKVSGKYFNVKTDTLFHNTKIPLPIWFKAIWIVYNENDQISSIRLGNYIGITQKTAWFILKRIKKYRTTSLPDDTKHNENIPPTSDKLQMSEWLKILTNKT